MKYKGQKLEGPNEELIIIPRGNAEDIVFKAKAVLNYDEFEKLVKEPVAPMIMMAGETAHKPMLNDPNFLKDRVVYDNQRFAWLMITSLSATEDLEWETIKKYEPSTWESYDEELRQAGFTNVEIGRVIEGVMMANSLNQSRIDEARASFLAMQRLEAAKLNSLQEDEKIMPSGEPASDSE